MFKNSVISRKLFSNKGKSRKLDSLYYEKVNDIENDNKADKIKFIADMIETRAEQKEQVGHDGDLVI